ncbi:hypothetical protein [Turneriella parva]|uniref:N-acetyltransferase domain-containing protein n=1 Tax=Turneriella parva (strain ATCC BAA-1111 / DSM 21527 / NCTC 11395 / H) TaxID=869212 RepID=I4B3A8_TURPD|nr:hypothetical protein [Turneriella parva]AFM11765.1 hypothetical protein Turpa_1117 [Turneriella parva DSM 21527]
MTTGLSGKTSERLESFGELELWLLGQDAIEEFNRHVYTVYNEAFGPVPMEEIAPAAYENFSRARVCGVRHASGKLVGTWGLIVRELGGHEAPLPTEKAYGLDLRKTVQDLGASEVTHVFNGWRTAINKEALVEFKIDRTQSIFIFDLLLRGLTQDFAGNENAFLGIADMEMLVYKYHRRIGIPWQQIGEAIHFWNRDRYPFAFKLGEYRDYMRAHHAERAAFLFDKDRGAA